MSESYTEGGDSLILLADGVRAGQIFTPIEDHILQWVDLNLHIGIFTVRVSVEIYNADINYNPVGERIAYGSIRPPDTIPPQVKRLRIPINEKPLLYAGLIYAIVVYHKYPIIGTAANWQYDAWDSTYPRGARISSDDGGEMWTKHYGDDHIFAEFGTPPAPPPPPEPPVTNWTTLGLQQILTETGYKIVVRTNVPCHLYMIWTNTHPEKHASPLYRRGAVWKDAIRFCFVGWHQNEQQEAGDTLYHTFIKEPWPVCETRWFVFRAKVDGTWSPSVSPIFEKHRAQAPISADFYPNPAVAGIVAQEYALEPGHSWNELRNAVGNAAYPPGAFVSIDVALQVAFNAVPDDWANLYRSIMIFDTSSIPATAEIISATLSLYGLGKTRNYIAGGSFGVFYCNPASNIQLQAADYSTFGDQPLSNLIIYDDWALVAYNVLTLSEAGKNLINKGGYTRLGVRERTYDARDWEPPWAQSLYLDVNWEKATGNPDKDPKLTVVYTL